jgi:hypothetical protein
MRDSSAPGRDRGQILPLVLAFVIFGGLVITAILSLTTTGLAVATRLQDQRDVRYAAAAAIDTHIEYLRANPSAANGTNPCPSANLTLNDTAVTVSCSNTGATTIGRDLDITAAVGGATVLSAAVFIDAGSAPDVFVNGWSYGAGSSPAP